MVNLASVFVSVEPDFSKVGPKVARELPRHIPDSVGDGIGSKLGARMGDGMRTGIAAPLRTMVGGLGAAFAAIGVANLFGSFISEAREAGVVTRITENAIRATGGAAGLTADQVGSLAESISNKTGIDDEAVQSSANLLLTFKAIRDEAGAGNDVFSRATALTQDLAAAGFGSADSAAKMLGKALNDPIAGLTALGRAGVTFTEQQKTQIRTLVETGDVLGAQRIILDEVAAQVGGAAAAAADPMQKLGVIVGNLKERLGTALLPMLMTVGLWLGDHLPGAISTASGWFGRLADVVRPLFQWIAGPGVAGFQALFEAFRTGEVTSGGFVGVMERIGAAVRAGVTGVKALIDAFRSGETTTGGFVGVMERIGVVARQVFDYFRSTVVPILGQVADFVQRNSDFFLVFAGTIVGIVAALRTWAVVQTALNVILSANPIGLVVVAVAALVAGLVVAYQRSETFRNIVQAAWQGIQQAVSYAWNSVIKPAVEALHSFLVNTLAPAVTRVWHQVVEPAFQGIAAAVRTAWGIVKPVLELVVAIFQQVVGPAITRFWRDTVVPAFNGFTQAIQSGWTTVRPILETLGRFISDNVAPAFRAGVTAIGRAWDGIQEVAKGPVRFVVDTVINDGVIDNFNRVAGFFGTAKIARLNLPRGFATGGWTGPGAADQVAGFVHAGEHVIRAESTRAMNRALPGLLDHINRTGGLPGYQTGGAVRMGTVSAQTWEQLKRAGWRGDPTDRMEALYPPPAPGPGWRLAEDGSWVRPGFFVGNRDGADGLGDIWDAVSGFLSDPLGALKRAVEGMLGGVGGSGFADMLRGVPGKLVDAAADKIRGLFGGEGGAVGAVGGGAGGRGWRWQMGFLRSIAPAIDLISGFRVSRTRSGAVSWHSRDGGRAVDVSPWEAVAQKIRAAFGANTIELITPWPAMNLLRGRPHRYSDAVMGDHDGRTNVRHIHWAYDQGGWLPPGLSLAYNGTGRPERVVAPQQEAGLAGGQFTGTLVLDSGQLLGVVRGEIRHAADTVARQVTYGKMP